MAADGTRGPATSTVLLDALGTLVGLEPPAPHLVQALAARGVSVTADAAGAALRAEMTYYRAEHHRAATVDGLRALRAECGAIVGRSLGSVADTLDEDALVDVLLESLRFFAYPEVPDVLRALRARGLRLVVCSNWDLSLHEVLAATGLDALVDGVVVSAVEGVAKPDAGLFARALALAGDAADPAAAVHIGDSISADVAGALGAGLRAVLVTREGDEVRSHEAAGGPALPASVPVIADLRGLLDLV